MKAYLSRLFVLVMLTFTIVSFAQQTNSLRDEVIALCDEPWIGTIGFRGDVETRAEGILWERVDALPDSAYDLAIEVLETPNQTDQRRAGAIDVATVLITRPNIRVSRRKELETHVVKQLKSLVWPDNARVWSSAIYSLSLVGGEESLKALAPYLRHPADYLRRKVEDAFWGIGTRVPNAEAIREAALAASLENFEKKTTPSAEPTPISAKPSLLPQSPPSRSIESSTHSFGVIWTFAAATVAVIICLSVFWGRRSK